jgi:hypothetical protein
MLLNYVINVYKDPLNERSFIRSKKKGEISV